MLIVNIDLTDRLVSVQLVIIYNITYTESQISKIYVKFDHPLAVIFTATCTKLSH